MKYEHVRHIPDDLEPNTLYISEEFATMTHICPCGCGMEIPVPIGPDGWTLTFNAGVASVTPSFGNRVCKAHYYITNGEFVFV